MKLHDQKLYLEFSDALESGIATEKYLWIAKSKGIKTFTFLKDPSDGRRVLIEYYSLKQEHKEKVIKRFGDPYEFVAKEPIRKMVSKDVKAEEFFLAYRYGDDNKKMLSIETVKKYVIATSWLNTLVKAEANKKEIKKNLNLSLADFWIKVGEIIDTDLIDLPAGYKRLREKVAEYATGGYKSVISKHHGNQRTLKVSSELAESLLLELISIPYHDDVVICRRYNDWAVPNDHKPITPRTVCYWRKNKEVLIMGAKEGNRQWHNKFGIEISGTRPSAPLFRVESDDNELDLYFLDGKNSYYRPVLYVVRDSFNDYILGYAVGNTVNTALVKEAYLNAIHHVKELTGGYYLPHDLQTDRWGVSKNLDNDLALFFKSVCSIYMPATVKNPRSKYIEQSFGKAWHKILKFYPNYSGHNITAKTKLNEDHKALNKKNYPLIDQAPDQIAQFIGILRNTIDEKTGKSKREEWVEEFEARTRSHTSIKLIDEMQMLFLLGQRHEYQNQITSRGITPAINCVERRYMIPEEYYLDAVGRKATVIYDHNDYSRVLVDVGNMRFIAYADKPIPRATLDYQEGDRTRLNQKFDLRKRLAGDVATKSESRKEILQRNRIDATSLISAGLSVPKNIKQAAVLAYQNSQDSKPTDAVDTLDQM